MPRDCYLITHRGLCQLEMSKVECRAIYQATQPRTQLRYIRVCMIGVNFPKMSTNFCSQFLKQPTASFSVNSLLSSGGMEEHQYHGDMTVSTTTAPLPTSTAPIADPKPDQPHAELDEIELWSRFNRLTNEMIVTKNGRFVFSRPFLCSTS